ncbi:glycoside hydrolase family 97 protein [Opitutus sp. ER46]|uniref:glycoside hydrolase family 97 protein n=1 Tax=Opitutus sp. ER46 TaxID=2161864 RepID=UPI000D303C05|nr:glycoside hydrolase family 97 protein [Opitutus sp. ER46]PTX91417.1 alpha-glucosidase [Opitutus sp. ER46]
MNAPRFLLATLALFGPVLGAARAAPAPVTSIASPDGALVVDVQLARPAGTLTYSVTRAGQPVLAASRLGLVRDDTDFTRGLTLVAVEPGRAIEEKYEILTAKRRANTYRANRQVVELVNADGAKLQVEFQVSNDGVAFRYVFPGTSAVVRWLREEVTSFAFLPGTRAWLQPMSEAKTGWSRVNPCYEEYFEKNIAVGTPSPQAGWVYPALFRSGDTWLVVSEAGLGRDYCGTRLRKESPNGEYTIGFPDARETFPGGPLNPVSVLPWRTPWRLIAIGSLQTVAESMLGIDLADPAPARAPAGRPGKASWSWPLLGDPQTTYDVQRQFIDYAAEMHWQYCLIDSMWDQQIGYEKVKELIDYARTKGVSVLLWYNSNGTWNDAPQTPRHRLLTHASRIQEFERLKAMGVAGLKIDFFGGDAQSMIAYYHDILADAAPYGFQMNFHGATLPRGWNRTYSQLMTMEAVKGLEYVTFDQRNADEEPAHATILPFTRNLFDPMDFTPLVLDRINKIERRTSSAFELALAVVFTSGIQHYAEIPAGMAKAPEYVREFLRHVPSVWDEVRFIDGLPGEFVVLARQGEGRWYVSGINAESTAKPLTLDLRRLGLPAGRKGMLIQDGAPGNLSFQQSAVNLGADLNLPVTLAPRGGFVLVFE